MTTWLLDTEAVIYLLTRPEPREGAPAPPVDAHRDALYRALDAFIDRVTAAGDRLLLTPLVVLEAATLHMPRFSNCCGGCREGASPGSGARSRI